MESGYHAMLFSVLFTVNIWFSIFVWMPSDLGPNFALAFITVPFMMMEFYLTFNSPRRRKFKRNKKGGKKK